ncbi:hypothetical protein V8F06_002481 [Rhypophila decipiens]
MQGTGRYTAEEVTSLRKEMIGMLGDFAEAASRARSAAHDEDDGPFWIMGGEKPSEADLLFLGIYLVVLGLLREFFFFSSPVWLEFAC